MIRWIIVTLAALAIFLGLRACQTKQIDTYQKAYENQIVSYQKEINNKLPHTREILEAKLKIEGFYRSKGILPLQEDNVLISQDLSPWKLSYEPGLLLLKDSASCKWTAFIPTIRQNKNVFFYCFKNHNDKNYGRCQETISQQFSAEHCPAGEDDERIDKAFSDQDKFQAKAAATRAAKKITHKLYNYVRDNQEGISTASDLDYGELSPLIHQIDFEEGKLEINMGHCNFLRFEAQGDGSRTRYQCQSNIYGISKRTSCKHSIGSLDHLFISNSGC